MDEALGLEIGNKHPGHPERYPDDRGDLRHGPGGVTDAQDALALGLRVDPVRAAGLGGGDQGLQRGFLDRSGAATGSQVGADPPTIRRRHRGAPALVTLDHPTRAAGLSATPTRSTSSAISYPT